MTLNSTDVIFFYSEKERFGFLSNFYPSPIIMGKKVWPTVEHYFQAQKFDNSKHQEKIRKACSPTMAAHLGRSRKIQVRRKWNDIRVNVMHLALYEKFNQHEDLRRELVSTGTKTLVEHTENDNFWGDGGDGSGKNQLGKLLMKIREKFQSLS